MGKGAHFNWIPLGSSGKSEVQVWSGFAALDTLGLGCTEMKSEHVLFFAKYVNLSSKSLCSMANSGLLERTTTHFGSNDCSPLSPAPFICVSMYTGEGKLNC